MPLALNYSGVRGNDFSTATTTRDAVGVKLTLWRIVYLLNALKFSSYTKQKNLKFYFKKKEKKNMKFLIQKNRRQLRQVKKNYKKKIVVYIYRRISQYKNLSLLGALIINFSVSFSLFFIPIEPAETLSLSCEPHSCCCSNHRNNRPPSIE